MFIVFLPTKNSLKRAVMFSITATRGGPVRLQIILLLLENPRNINELSKRLNMDYKTVQHHMRVLEKSNLIMSSRKRYGNAYKLSTLLLSNKDIIETLKELGKSK